MLVLYADMAVAATNILPGYINLSSTRMQHVAQIEATKTATWLRNVLQEIWLEQEPAIIFRNNVGWIE